MDNLLKNMVSSMTAGRIRLRSPYLRNRDLAHQLAALAVNIDGILDVTVNPLVGSALLLYDPEVLSTQELMAQAESFFALLPSISALPESTGAYSGAKRASVVKLIDRKALNASLTLSLAGTLASAYLARRIHPKLGWVFIGLTALHYLQTKK
ncbi:MAG: hypothetical protein LBV76_06035 [Deltaproteobacteria bacterium]|jgi:hypothetical protein|nr:hypothetical protein [Deltaproteobacteria bacterium]